MARKHRGGETPGRRRWRSGSCDLGSRRTRRALAARSVFDARVRILIDVKLGVKRADRTLGSARACGVVVNVESRGLYLLCRNMTSQRGAGRTLNEITLSAGASGALQEWASTRRLGVRRSRALIRAPRVDSPSRGRRRRDRRPWAPGCSRAPRRRMQGLGIPRRTSRSRRTTTFTCAPGTSSTTPRSNARFTTTSPARRRTSSSRSASTAWTRTPARPSSDSSPISRTAPPRARAPPGTPPPLARTSSGARPAPRRGRVPDRRS